MLVKFLFYFLNAEMKCDNKLFWINIMFFTTYEAQCVQDTMRGFVNESTKIILQIYIKSSYLIVIKVFYS